MPRLALRVYAQAYLEAAGSAEQAVQAFDACMAALDTVPGLRGFVANQAMSVDARRRALQLAAEGATKEAIHFFLLLAKDKRLRDLPVLAQLVREEGAAMTQKTHAVVTSAVPLTAAITRRLTQILSARFGRDVWLETQVDPQVIAGLRVQAGDWVFDATHRGRLNRLERVLM